MSERKYKLAVFIGRFQGYHLGHHSVIQNALDLAENVLVLIGSANEPRTLRNPFTYKERVGVIYSSFDFSSACRIYTRPLEDHLYNDERWIEQVQSIVRDVANDIADDIEESDITLVGHSKDNTSYYLKLFPQWDANDCGNINNLSSTNIREVYFNAGVTDYISGIVTAGSQKFLIDFTETEDYNRLVSEQVYVDNYKASYAHLPYPPVFVTVDAVVVQSGHVLLVKRKGYPGRGLWALPGGFLNNAEKIEDGMLRELREETRIKVPAPVLRGNIVKRQVFDDPNRSSRGRTITHAFYINLPADVSLPKVRGSDDAEKAKWVPLSRITRSEMFEDHYHIIETLVGTD